MGEYVRIRNRALCRPLILFLCAFFSESCIRQIAGNFKYSPNQLNEKLSPGAKALLDQALKNIDSGRLLDHHTHILGTGRGGTGAFVHEDMTSWLHPISRIKYSVYLNAAHIKDESRLDQEYMDRLIDLIKNSPKKSRYFILGFDKNHTPDGKVNLEKTEFYVPNEYIYSLSQKYKDIFLPAVSIHPYRKDAIQKLEKWGEKGVRLIKWLPNTMGIDPSHSKTTLYYQTMKKYGMALLTHTGEEQAVEGGEGQRYGNPLLLRKPLDMGVPVIAAHCASLGDDLDLDAAKKDKRVTSFDLFLRLMDEQKYEGLLYGGISAMTQFNRLTKPIITMLDREDLHHRLVNGSDYPLPAINILIRTSEIHQAGMITEKEKDSLNEIYHINPLLFDFVLKRTIRSPKTNKKFSPVVFYEKNFFAE